MALTRVKGRSPRELRPVTIERHYLKYAEGSVLISIGDTRVICSATVEEKVPPFLRNSGRGWITAEYALLPRSTRERTVREATRGRPSGRTQEIQRLIGRALRSVVDTAVLGERTIWLDCDVLQADGGTRTAAITGSFVALADALAGLVAAGTIPRLPLQDFLAAISVGLVDGELLLDLDFEEDSHASIDMNVVMTGSGQLVEVQGTAEKQPFSREEMAAMLDLAGEGIARLIAIQRQVLGPLADQVGTGYE
ncbi:MAG: ribonuclease [Moorella sp. (in: firmicutes)]|nr:MULTISPECIES: ribonuclease PH [unclassified Moorella (in: firmicutes)]MDK2815686.1 ribonuclease [Moorella sp. (in: firmicutes)]MDK2895298.1 ribonuclease [Moorella sp. (in: firmicutes)]GEA16373.1 ribonuclease PH [Moorella sp. E308F]GEA17462.1 ribonuclease PH [Moorella sp. E306M]